MTDAAGTRRIGLRAVAVRLGGRERGPRHDIVQCQLQSRVSLQTTRDSVCRGMFESVERSQCNEVRSRALTSAAGPRAIRMLNAHHYIATQYCQYLLASASRSLRDACQHMPRLLVLGRLRRLCRCLWSVDASCASNV